MTIIEAPIREISQPLMNDLSWKDRMAAWVLSPDLYNRWAHVAAIERIQQEGIPQYPQLAEKTVLVTPSK